MFKQGVFCASEFEEILFNVTKPYQYIGSEYLSANKDFEAAEVTIAFAFPDKYEIGISNLGQKILYDVVNKVPRFMGDRAYAPDVDFKDALEASGKLLYALESKRALKEFDFIGFSMQYELSYPTVLKMLDLSGIPILSSDRAASDPIILAGGPCCYNPEPMGRFIDIFLVGDSEELILEVMELYERLKSGGTERDEIIFELGKLKGVYAPMFYDHKKPVPEALRQGLPKKVTKRIFDLNKGTEVEYYPVPHSSAVHDRTTVEIRRGCGRMCRFCQSGHTNLPIREQSAENIIKKTKSLAQKTGYDEFSLLSLSSNDYTNIESVVKELTQELSPKNISASLPSQRVDRFSVELAKLVQTVRKSTTTLAPEAGSQRLRNVINKNLSKEQILKTALDCYQNGFSSIKFYFMIGLPTETREDIDELLELLREIIFEANKLKKELGLSKLLNITCSLSIFVPKPFTPFQWFGQESLESLYEKIGYIREKSRSIKGVKINIHDKFTSVIEAVLTRGDYALGKYIQKLYEKGCYLDSWGENFSKTTWVETAEELGISLDKLAQREYALEEPLCWEIIDTGIEKTWFQNEYKNALKAAVSIPCEFKCSDCGACKNLGTKQQKDNPYEAKPPKAQQKLDQVFYYRLKLAKTGNLKYTSHLDWQNLVTKTLFRSGLNLAFSQGFNPTPKVSFSGALPLFIQSETEFLDIELHDDLSEQSLKNIFEKILPKEVRIIQIVKKDKRPDSIDIEAQWALYEFTPLKKELLNSETLVYIIDTVRSDDDLFIKKKNKKGIEKTVNIKHSIKEATVENGKLRMILKTGQNSEIPALRADTAIRYFLEDADFNITRLKFYDINLKEL